MQADTAVVDDIVGQRDPFSQVRDANVLQTGDDVADIVRIAAVAVMDAGSRSK